MAFNQIKTSWWFSRSNRRHATKQDLQQAVEKIMSVISDAVSDINEDNARTEASIGTLSVEISALKTLIVNLTAGQGSVSPADKALLDSSVARAAAIATSLEALVTQAVPPAASNPTP
jgi:ribosomal protein L23